MKRLALSLLRAVVFPYCCLLALYAFSVALTCWVAEEIYESIFKVAVTGEPLGMEGEL